MSGYDEFVTCTACGAGFFRGADEPWKRLCLSCWRRKKSGTESHSSTTCAACYQRGLAAGRAEAPAAPRTTLDKARLRELMQLVHPDKHNGSSLAVRVTQWLNELRRTV